MLTADTTHNFDPVRDASPEKRVPIAVAAAALLAMVVLPAAAQTTTRAPCTLVVGQGRFPAEAAAANAPWDRINATLATQVAGELAGLGERTLRIALPVEFDDVAAIVGTLLAHAAREGCDRIVETSLFVDAAAELIVARLRAYPVLRESGGSRIGDPSHLTRREYPDNQRNRDRLQPAALGRELAADYLRQAADRSTAR